MFRVGAQRVAVRSLAASTNNTTTAIAAQRFARFTSQSLSKQTGLASRSKTLALSVQRANTSIVRSYASGAAPGVTRREDKEAQFRSGSLVADPSHVSSSSSATPVFSGRKEEDDTDMMAGIRHDMKVIKDTFALDSVPRGALNVGLAGVIPYLTTSAATVFCAIEMNAAAKTGSGYLLSEATAESLLYALEPIQVGYGAVILSCLGTIHWGLEWAGYGGAGGWKRYAIGVLAPAVAWPTIFLPVEYALVSQFLAFNIFYSIDSATTSRGWTPPWYSSYRFILTFVVGTSIVISLIGRGQIQDRIGRLPTATDRFRELQALGKAANKDKQAETEAAEEEE